jgi:hypothetical protein
MDVLKKIIDHFSLGNIKQQDLDCSQAHDQSSEKDELNQKVHDIIKSSGSPEVAALLVRGALEFAVLSKKVTG